MNRDRSFPAALTAVGAVAVALLAGCGSDQGDGDRQPTPQTRQQYVADVNAICAEGPRDLARVHREINAIDPDQIRQRDDVARELYVDPLQAEIDRIIQLEPPPGDEDQVDAMISEMQLVADQVDSNARLLRTSSPRLALRYRHEVAAANRLARDYGLTACRV